MRTPVSDTQNNDRHIWAAATVWVKAASTGR